MSHDPSGCGCGHGAAATADAETTRVGSWRELARFAAERFTPVELVRSERLKVVLACFEPGQEIPVHRPDVDLVLVTLEGRGSLLAGGEPVPLEPGSLGFVPAGRPRGIRAETRMVVLHVASPPPGPADAAALARAAGRELDLRGRPEEERLGDLRAAFDALEEGESIRLLSERDPRPLFRALDRERAGLFLWIPSAAAGGVHAAQAVRLKPKETETSINEYFTRDHDEIDAHLSYLRWDLAAAARGEGPGPAALAEQFELFDRRLERHIRWEEEILFPEVEAKDDRLAQGPGRVMRMEHREIRLGKTMVRELLADPARAAKAAEILEEVVSVLVGHNQKEENVYYPLSEQIFGPAEAADLLARVRALR
jgi:quercetin dioxygenase-like cupin family protein/iron-sulfur cluster repair protein YtfE (RIC family)